MASNEKQMSPQMRDELVAVFAALPQGVVTFGSDLRIQELHNPAAAAHLSARKSPVGQDIAALLFSDEAAQQAAGRRFRYELAVVFNNHQLQWDVSHRQLPNKLQRTTPQGEQILRLQYLPFFDEKGLLHKIALIIDDITTSEGLREQIEESEHKLEIIADLLKVHDSVFIAFLDETERIFEQCHLAIGMLSSKKGEQVQAAFETLMRQIHTLKGCAGLFNLVAIQNAAHAVEEKLISVKEKGPSGDTLPIVQVSQLVTSIEEEVARYLAVRRELLNREFDPNAQDVPHGHALWLLSLTERLSQAMRNPLLSLRDIDALFFELQRAAERLGKTNLTHHLRRFDQMIERQASEAGKLLRPLLIEGEDLYFDVKTITRIADMITHCVNNAVSHGIETPEERERAGKLRAGQISVRCEREHGIVTIHIHDDGRGIDPAQIALHAVQRGLVSAEEIEEMDDGQLLQLIFSPGFSTATTISQASGRGFGMSAIYEVVRELSGDMGMQTTPGRGCLIELRIPDPDRQALPHFGLFDLADAIRHAMPPSRRFHTQVIFDPDSRGKDFPMFGDRIALHQFFHSLHHLIFDHSNQTGPVTLSVQPLAGKRKVDSEQFYRITLSSKGFKLPANILNSHPFARVKELLPRVQGAMRVTKKGALEINIASGMPQQLDNFHFEVVFCLKDATLARRFVENYFSTQMRFATITFAHSIDGLSAPAGPRIIIVDDSHLARYPEALAAAAAEPHTQWVLVSDDPHSLPSAVMKNIPSLPLVVAPPFTRSLAFQVLELTVLKLLVMDRFQQVDLLEEEEEAG